MYVLVFALLLGDQVSSIAIEQPDSPHDAANGGGDRPCLRAHRCESLADSVVGWGRQS